QREKGGFNHFTPYLEQRRVDNLTRETIIPYLAELQGTRRLEIDESTRPYQEGREFQRKYGISEESFQNWKRLLSGWLGFPAILLLNPTRFDDLSFEKMVENSPTLQWTQKTLQDMELELDDVIVLDTFPMVTDKLLKIKRLQGAHVELVQDSFRLTLTCLRHIRPQVLVSCQCCSRAGNETWGVVMNKKADELCSSGLAAKDELVKEVEIGDHMMQVVQGVHPQYVVQYNEAMEDVLQRLFRKVFKPFGKWKKQRLMAWKELTTISEIVKSSMESLLKQMKLYQQICGRVGEAYAPGAVMVKQMEEWESVVDGW
ncbi:uncharacterized protein BO97DRAFT_332040, partial [Aspergillus homomorphus CBS 101889]